MAALLWLVFFRMEATLGFKARFGGPATMQHSPMWDFLYVRTNEHLFWIAHIGLALPAAILTGWSLAPGFERLRARLRELGAAEASRWRRWLGGYGLLLFATAMLMHALVMLGGPVTDDEYAVRFGAEIWLEGGLSVELPDPRSAFLLPFTYLEDGRISSMDFPGAIAVRALSLVTHLGALLYAAMAALTGVLVVATVERLWGRRIALLAMLVWALCPLALWVSATTHAHVASRLGIAAALYLLARLETEGATRGRDFFALGLVAGLAFCVRPAETGALLAPLGALWALRAGRRQAGAARGLGLALLGLLGPLLAFAAYNAALTGDPLVQARFVPDKILATQIEPLSSWDRIGVNAGHNLSLVTVYAGGPLMVASWIAGILSSGRHSARGAYVAALILGLAMHAALALLHDDVGVHVVGPMHFTDTAPSLVVLAAAGWHFIDTRWTPGPWHARVFGAVLCAGVLGYGSFAWVHGKSVREASELRDAPHAFLDAQGVEDAIILAFPPGYYFNFDAEISGAWVLQNPYPHPSWSKGRIFVAIDADAAALARAFPDRPLLRLTRDPQGDQWSLTAVAAP